MHVRMLATRFPHIGAHSGMRPLVRSLNAGSCDVRLCEVSDSDDVPVWPKVLRRRLRKIVGRRGMAWYKLSDLAAELRALPGCLLGRTDVVHFLDGEHSAQYLPLMLERLTWCRAATVATFHQPPELLEDLLSSEVVASIDRVTVVSPTQIPYFRRHLPGDRVDLILHGVDADFFAPAPHAPLQKRLKCITVGHWLRDWSAVHRVAEELLPHKHIEFHVVTDRATGLEKQRNVVFHRGLDDAALRALYQACDVLFLPLTGATANNAVLEGIACGLPVVSTRLPSIEAYVSTGVAILVDDNDADRLVEAILRLDSDRELRLAMGRCARARAEELSWASVAPMYEAVYSSVTARGKLHMRGVD